MTYRRFSPTQIAEALQALEAGVKLPEVCRRFAVSELTLRRWQRKSGLLQPPVDAVTPVALTVEQAANRVAGLERRLEAFRLVLVSMLEPAELEEAARLLEANLSASSRRARQLLGLPLRSKAADPIDAGGAETAPLLLPRAEQARRS